MYNSFLILQYFLKNISKIFKNVVFALLNVSICSFKRVQI
jgi:hypothetical protein